MHVPILSAPAESDYILTVSTERTELPSSLELTGLTAATTKICKFSASHNLKADIKYLTMLIIMWQN